MFSKKYILKITSVIAILSIIITICGCSGTEVNTLFNKKETIAIDKDNFEDYFNVNISVDFCNIEEYVVGLYRADGQMTITINPYEKLEAENLVVKIRMLDCGFWKIEGADAIGNIELTLPNNGSLTKTIHCDCSRSIVRPEYLTGKYLVKLGSGTINV